MGTDEGANPEVSEHHSTNAITLAFVVGISRLNAGSALGALECFQGLLRARPDEGLYHAYVGWALFLAYGRSLAWQARRCVVHALTLDPDLDEAHWLLERLPAVTAWEA